MILQITNKENVFQFELENTDLEETGIYLTDTDECYDKLGHLIQEHTNLYETVRDHLQLDESMLMMFSINFDPIPIDADSVTGILLVQYSKKDQELCDQISFIHEMIENKTITRMPIHAESVIELEDVIDSIYKQRYKINNLVAITNNFNLLDEFANKTLNELQTFLKKNGFELDTNKESGTEYKWQKITLSNLDKVISIAPYLNKTDNVFKEKDQYVIITNKDDNAIYEFSDSIELINDFEISYIAETNKFVATVETILQI